jgi:hypothetical protein
VLDVDVDVVLVDVVEVLFEVNLKMLPPFTYKLPLKAAAVYKFERWWCDAWIVN